jgi:hypothetical protein
MEKLVGAAGGNQAAGGAGGASSYEALKKLDQQWLQMRSMTTTTQGTHAHTRTHATPRSKSFMVKTSFAAISQLLLLVLDLVLFLFLFHTCESLSWQGFDSKN